jgi:hypothetical protein
VAGPVEARLKSYRYQPRDRRSARSLDKDMAMCSPPKEERDLLMQGACNRSIALDNLSSLPLWLSNGLCRLSTGGGHSARELYTDLKEISIAVKRPVILNGIENVATRPDPAERVL